MARPLSRPQRVLDEPTAAPTWLYGMLVLSCVLLLLQLFPSLLSTIVGSLDLRQWGWKAYSAFFSALIVVLVALRALQERAHDSD